MVRKALHARRWNINKIRIVSKSGPRQAFGMNRAKSTCETIRARRQRRKGARVGGGGFRGDRVLGHVLPKADWKLQTIYDNDFTIYSR